MEKGRRHDSTSKRLLVRRKGGARDEDSFVLESSDNRDKTNHHSNDHGSGNKHKGNSSKDKKSKHHKHSPEPQSREDSYSSSNGESDNFIEGGSSEEYEDEYNDEMHELFPSDNYFKKLFAPLVVKEKERLRQIITSSSVGGAGSRDDKLLIPEMKSQRQKLKNIIGTIVNSKFTESGVYLDNMLKSIEVNNIEINYDHEVSWIIIQMAENYRNYFTPEEEDPFKMTGVPRPDSYILFEFLALWFESVKGGILDVLSGQLMFLSQIRNKWKVRENRIRTGSGSHHTETGGDDDLIDSLSDGELKSLSEMMATYQELTKDKGLRDFLGNSILLPSRRLLEPVFKINVLYSTNEVLIKKLLGVVDGVMEYGKVDQETLTTQIRLDIGIETLGKVFSNKVISLFEDPKRPIQDHFRKFTVDKLLGIIINSKYLETYENIKSILTQIIGGKEVEVIHKYKLLEMDKDDSPSRSYNDEGYCFHNSNLILRRRSTLYNIYDYNIAYLTIVIKEHLIVDHLKRIRDEYDNNRPEWRQCSEIMYYGKLIDRLSGQWANVTKKSLSNIDMKLEEIEAVMKSDLIPENPTSGKTPLNTMEIMDRFFAYFSTYFSEKFVLKGEIIYGREDNDEFEEDENEEGDGFYAARKREMNVTGLFPKPLSFYSHLINIGDETRGNLMHNPITEEENKINIIKLLVSLVERILLHPLIQTTIKRQFISKATVKVNELRLGIGGQNKVLDYFKPPFNNIPAILVPYPNIPSFDGISRNKEIIRGLLEDILFKDKEYLPNIIEDLESVREIKKGVGMNRLGRATISFKSSNAVKQLEDDWNSVVDLFFTMLLDECYKQVTESIIDEIKETTSNRMVNETSSDIIDMCSSTSAVQVSTYYAKLFADNNIDFNEDVLNQLRRRVQLIQAERSERVRSGKDKEKRVKTKRFKEEPEEKGFPSPTSRNVVGAGGDHITKEEPFDMDQITQREHANSPRKNSGYNGNGVDAYEMMEEEEQINFSDSDLDLTDDMLDNKDSRGRHGASRSGKISSQIIKKKTKKTSKDNDPLLTLNLQPPSVAKYLLTSKNTAVVNITHTDTFYKTRKPVSPKSPNTNFDDMKKAIVTVTVVDPYANILCYYETTSLLSEAQERDLSRRLSATNSGGSGGGRMDQRSFSSTNSSFNDPFGDSMLFGDHSSNTSQFSIGEDIRATHNNTITELRNFLLTSNVDRILFGNNENLLLNRSYHRILIRIINEINDMHQATREACSQSSAGNNKKSGEDATWGSPAGDGDSWGSGPGPVSGSDSGFNSEPPRVPSGNALSHIDIYFVSDKIASFMIANGIFLPNDVNIVNILNSHMPNSCTLCPIDTNNTSAQMNVVNNANPIEYVANNIQDTATIVAARLSRYIDDISNIVDMSKALKKTVAINSTFVNKPLEVKYILALWEAYQMAFHSPEMTGAVQSSGLYRIGSNYINVAATGNLASLMYCVYLFLTTASIAAGSPAILLYTIAEQCTPFHLCTLCNTPALTDHISMYNDSDRDNIESFIVNPLKLYNSIRRALISLPKPGINMCLINKYFTSSLPFFINSGIVTTKIIFDYILNHNAKMKRKYNVDYLLAGSKVKSEDKNALQEGEKRIVSIIKGVAAFAYVDRLAVIINNMNRSKSSRVHGLPPSLLRFSDVLACVGSSDVQRSDNDVSRSLTIFINPSIEANAPLTAQKGGGGSNSQAASPQMGGASAGAASGAAGNASQGANAGQSEDSKNLKNITITNQISNNSLSKQLAWGLKFTAANFRFKLFRQEVKSRLVLNCIVSSDRLFKLHQSLDEINGNSPFIAKPRNTSNTGSGWDTEGFNDVKAEDEGFSTTFGASEDKTAEDIGMKKQQIEEEIKMLLSRLTLKECFKVLNRAPISTLMRLLRHFDTPSAVHKFHTTFAPFLSYGPDGALTYREMTIIVMDAINMCIGPIALLHGGAGANNPVFGGEGFKHNELMVGDRTSLVPHDSSIFKEFVETALVPCNKTSFYYNYHYNPYCDEPGVLFSDFDVQRLVGDDVGSGGDTGYDPFSGTNSGGGAGGGFGETGSLEQDVLHNIINNRKYTAKFRFRYTIQNPKIVQFGQPANGYVCDILDVNTNTRSGLCTQITEDELSTTLGTTDIDPVGKTCEIIVINPYASVRFNPEKWGGFEPQNIPSVKEQGFSIFETNNSVIARGLIIPNENIFKREKRIWEQINFFFKSHCNITTPEGNDGLLINEINREIEQAENQDLNRLQDSERKMAAIPEHMTTGSFKERNIISPYFRNITYSEAVRELRNAQISSFLFRPSRHDYYNISLVLKVGKDAYATYEVKEIGPTVVKDGPLRPPLIISGCDEEYQSFESINIGFIGPVMIRIREMTRFKIFTENVTEAQMQMKGTVMNSLREGKKLITPYRITWTPRDVRGPFMLMYPIRRRGGGMGDMRTESMKQSASTTAGKTVGGTSVGRGENTFEEMFKFHRELIWVSKNYYMFRGAKIAQKDPHEIINHWKRNITNHEIQNSW